ncbi:hypothetical protein EON65_47520 [archaeon]|nr:MAG: hypothetical protein EON65_47520 [archaeon]
MSEFLSLEEKDRDEEKESNKDKILAMYAAFLSSLCTCYYNATSMQIIKSPTTHFLHHMP